MPNDLSEAISSRLKEEYSKGKNDGISLAFRYQGWCDQISEGIDLAVGERSLNKKRVILRGLITYNIYTTIENYPGSKDFSRKKEELEALAEDNGFVMTEKGVYLDNYTLDKR